uniref:Uncharacterized protein n=1 Tax=Avena sativa TaxID=4498 RepID=A0ACD6AA93_AVESA
MERETPRGPPGGGTAPPPWPLNLAKKFSGTFGIPPFRHYHEDIWIEVFKHIPGSGLIRLSATCRWLRSLVAEDSVWRFSFFRDFSLPTGISHLFPCPLVHGSWRLMYFNIMSFWFKPGKNIDWYPIGGLLVDTQSLLLTGMLALPQQSPPEAKDSIEMTGACQLQNVRPGIWIAEMDTIGCLTCKECHCLGKTQVLDAHHCEWYPREDVAEYNDVGAHVNKNVNTAAAGIFNPRHLQSKDVAAILNAKSWIRPHLDYKAKARQTPLAVAISTNIPPNNGLLSKFQAAQDMHNGGDIVSVRIIQQLI